MSSDHVRDELDRFYTPLALTRAIVDVVAAGGIVKPTTMLEPSCGRGAFIVAARERWRLHDVTAIDLDSTVREDVMALNANFYNDDFISPKVPMPAWAQLSAGAPMQYEQARYDLILGNPPYGKKVPGRARPLPVAQEHVERALSLLSPRGVMAMLLRQSFLNTPPRARFLCMHRPAEIHHLVQRPSFTVGGATDEHEYVVIVWRGQAAAHVTTTHWMSWR